MTPTTTTTPTREQIIRAAKLCQQSYSAMAGISWLDIEDLRFGLFTKGMETELCFRGSYNWRNWGRDLFVMPKRSFDGFLIHGGVADAVETLVHGVKALLPKGGTLKVYGHSLGGGIAREFARMLGGKAITFGALRTDYRFGAMPVTDHYRVICADDPVPMIPGALYVQDRPADLCLASPPWVVVDPEDHFISHYLERLESA